MTKLQLKSNPTFHVFMLVSISSYPTLWKQIRNSKTLKQCFYLELLASKETCILLPWHRIKKI